MPTCHSPFLGVSSNSPCFSRFRICVHVHAVACAILSMVRDQYGIIWSANKWVADSLPSLTFFLGGLECASCIRASMRKFCARRGVGRLFLIRSGTGESFCPVDIFSTSVFCLPISGDTFHHSNLSMHHLRYRAYAIDSGKSPQLWRAPRTPLVLVLALVHMIITTNFSLECSSIYLSLLFTECRSGYTSYLLCGCYELSIVLAE